jgi:hypothetical protein
MLGIAREWWIVGAAVLAGVVFVVADVLHRGGRVTRRSSPSADHVEKLAAALHDDWRKARYRPATGDYEPRLKTTRDEAWIGAHYMKDEVDIANTPFSELPIDWQAENRVAAQIAIRVVEEAAARGRALDAAFIEEASAYVHRRWVERNGANAPDDQKLDYASLSEENKEKDRAIVRTAIRVLKG